MIGSCHPEDHCEQNSPACFEGKLPTHFSHYRLLASFSSSVHQPIISIISIPIQGARFHYTQAILLVQQAFSSTSPVPCNWLLRVLGVPPRIVGWGGEQRENCSIWQAAEQLPLNSSWSFQSHLGG